MTLPSVQLYKWHHVVEEISHDPFGRRNSAFCWNIHHVDPLVKKKENKIYAILQQPLLSPSNVKYYYLLFFVSNVTSELFHPSKKNKKKAEDVASRVQTSNHDSPEHDHAAIHGSCNLRNVLKFQNFKITSITRSLPLTLRHFH